MSGSAEIPYDVDVYRVIKPAMMALHIPEGAMYPTWEAFRPTDDDKRYSPIRVSVWDSRLTSVRQAKLLRVAASAINTDRGVIRDLHAFALVVACVTQRAQEFKSQKMRAVLDPGGVAPEIAMMPGAEGHAGIEGLDRQPGQPKPEWKDLLLALAKCCRAASEEPTAP
jgi:hypothetical protein